ncbi:MAG: hypothetical protein O9264_04600 [Leptospira sp.]|nr:hypothetical protein [Leptospira sp.]
MTSPNESKMLLEHPLFPKVIEAYQKSLVKRYSSESLLAYPQYKSISRSTIDLMIQFFIDALYPEHSKRLELDAAFQSLSGFVNHPSKLWGILGNLAASIFKFGRHFPAALSAGLAALHSYVTAHKFEETLIREAITESEEGDPFSSDESFNRILARIPQKDADAFRQDITKLFKIFTDGVLVDKIVIIMQDVLKRMESKGSLYTIDDHRAIQLGINILRQGKFIFERLSKDEMLLIIGAIDTIERDFFLNAKRLSK